MEVDWLGDFKVALEVESNKLSSSSLFFFFINRVGLPRFDTLDIHVIRSFSIQQTTNGPLKIFCLMAKDLSLVASLFRETVEICMNLS